MTILDQHETLRVENTGLSTIMALIGGGLIPADIWREKAYRAKFCLRTLLAPRQTLRFFNEMTRNRYFSALLSAQKTLPSKIHRHYLHLGLNAASRVDAIVSHYAFIDRLDAGQLGQALTSADKVSLIHLTGKEGEEITVRASSASGAEREGESTLWLYMNETLLASVTFCVTGPAGDQQIVIGGLQGASRHVPHETIKIATKACHGLFPKRLLMENLWLLAQRQNINAVYGVSDGGHVFRGLRYRLSKGKHFHASYNEFWKSVGGEKYDSHLFSLPLSLPQKDLSEIPSKKRSEYRKRYALLDALKQEFTLLR